VTERRFCAPARTFSGGLPIQNVAFDDAATLAMGEAFEKACKSLRNFGSASTVREIIAKRIIEAARYGERDPARLQQQALIPFGIEDMSVVSIFWGVPSPVQSRTMH
jgi:hypothetical protein